MSDRQVAADAVQAAADAYLEAVRDGTMGDFAEAHYSPGQNLPHLWLTHRARELRGDDSDHPYMETLDEDERRGD